MTNNDHKHPSAAFWATVVVVVALVGYPLSIGPVAGLWSKLDQPSWMKPVVAAYAPIVWAVNKGPIWLQEGVRSYCLWWRSLL